MTTSELHNFIERYFNAETTLAEEKELRRRLADCSPGDSLANEAKAVMGMRARR
ncbi:MAG: hypothetical protein HDS68_00115 [Bacteroidales bacterium]|nr:hypothetical protein [Bacteroidales bacterium]